MKSIGSRTSTFLSALFPPRILASAKFYARHRYLPSLSNPTTFSELVHHRKLSIPDPRFKIYADKLRVKEIVSEQLGGDWLIPTMWSGCHMPEENPGWAFPFVIKANFGCGLNAFVRAPEELKWSELRRMANEWMKLQWPRLNFEEWYNAIPRRILVEPMIGNGELPDFKFWVFGGEVAYIQVDTDRFGAHRRTFFSPNWKKQDFTYGYPAIAPETIAPPIHLTEMLHAACILGAPFSFARIDLYDLPEGPKFGEVTFSPARGLKCFRPVEIDTKLGGMWLAALNST